MFILFDLKFLFYYFKYSVFQKLEPSYMYIFFYFKRECIFVLKLKHRFAASCSNARLQTDFAAHCLTKTMC